MKNRCVLTLGVTCAVLSIASLSQAQVIAERPLLPGCDTLDARSPAVLDQGFVQIAPISKLLNPADHPTNGQGDLLLESDGSSDGSDLVSNSTAASAVPSSGSTPGDALAGVVDVGGTVAPEPGPAAFLTATGVFGAALLLRRRAGRSR